MNKTVVLRKAASCDCNFLREMLYESVYIPEGVKKPPFSIIDEPGPGKYLEGWMKDTDTGVIAEKSGVPIGAAWARKFDNAEEGAYGFIAPHIPELAIALKPGYRGQGIGEMLMKELFIELASKGIKGLSLSVNKQNRAVNFYLKLGFKYFREQETDCLMIKKLQ